MVYVVYVSPSTMYMYTMSGILIFPIHSKNRPFLKVLLIMSCGGLFFWNKIWDFNEHFWVVFSSGALNQTLLIFQITSKYAWLTAELMNSYFDPFLVKIFTLLGCQSEWPKTSSFYWCIPGMLGTYTIQNKNNFWNRVYAL